jgi:Zn-finger protein
MDKAPPIKQARICYQCDKDLYPKGKIITDDQFAHKDSKGNWHCVDCLREDFNNELIRRLPNSLATKNIVAERAAKEKKKLAIKRRDATRFTF